MFIKSSLFVLSILSILVFARASNENENELAHKLGHIVSAEENQDGIQEIQLLEHPQWLKRALPRMGKRFYDQDSNDDEFDSDSDETDLYDSPIYKRALPRMGRALPRMGRALPRMGRALPRMGRALPRMG